jgi:hypothetical protein
MIGMRMGMGLGAPSGVTTPVVYNSYAQTWWNALPAGLKINETTYLPIYSNFADAVTNTVLAKLDCLYICANHESTGEIAETSACTYNFINPANYHATRINAGTNLITTKNTGISGNMTSALDLNYNPGGAGTYNNTQNNHSFGVWVNNVGSLSTTDMGAVRSTTTGQLVYRTSAAKIGARSSSPYGASTRNFSTGLVTVRRNVSSAFLVTPNVDFGGYSLPIASTTMADRNIYLLCGNTDGTASSYTDRTISFAYAGAYLDNAEITLLYNAMSGLLTALAGV